MSKTRKIVLEVMQFVPVITFAVSFIVSGDVDLGRAAILFFVSAALAVGITAFLAVQKFLLNPILLGTNIWLCCGALAFGIPVPIVSELIAEQRAVGLFACVLGLGLVLTWMSSTGFVGMEHPNQKVVRSRSFLLLLLTVGALAWSYINVDNIRLGGGLPFILLNIFRRLIIRQASRHL